MTVGFVIRMHGTRPGDVIWLLMSAISALVRGRSRTRLSSASLVVCDAASIERPSSTATTAPRPIAMLQAAVFIFPM